MAIATNDTTPTALTSEVLLAFDDFSLAGRHLLDHITINDATSAPLPTTALPEALGPHVHVTQYTKDQRASLSVVTVTTAALTDAALLWTIADALVQWFSANDITSLRIIASLHLPQAKPHVKPLDNVYTATVNGDATSTSPLATLESTWEITDAFVVRLLHFVRVEQAFTTQLVVVKGYRPGRDGAGMRDALTALAAALPLVVKDLTVDLQRAEAQASKTLLTQPTDSTQQHHNLLYQ